MGGKVKDIYVKGKKVEKMRINNVSKMYHLPRALLVYHFFLFLKPTFQKKRRITYLRVRQQTTIFKGGMSTFFQLILWQFPKEMVKVFFASSFIPERD